jgi:hypothetical protein
MPPQSTATPIVTQKSLAKGSKESIGQAPRSAVSWIGSMSPCADPDQCGPSPARSPADPHVAMPGSRLVHPTSVSVYSFGS